MDRMKNVVLAVVAFFAVASVAQAQTFQQLDEALWVSRICVHEATWHGADGEDCGALHQLLRNRASQQGIGLVEALSRYSSRFYSGTSPRAWAAQLHPANAANPIGWPPMWPPFSHFASSYAQVFDRSLAAVMGHESPPCDGAPYHWGSRDPRLPDHRRAMAAIARGSWRYVECGDTVNAHYEVVRATLPRRD